MLRGEDLSGMSKACEAKWVDASDQCSVLKDLT